MVFDKLSPIQSSLFWQSMSISAYLVYGGGTPGQTVFHQVNRGGTPGPGQTVFHRLNRLEVKGKGKVLSPSLSWLRFAFQSISFLSPLCFVSLRLFSKSQRVLYKGFYKIPYLLPCFVFVFCWFSLFLLFPDWPTRFLQLTKGAITLFYDKQLHVTLFYDQQPCYTTMLHFSVINNSGERSHFFLWQTSS